MKLGKKAPRHDPRTLRLARYLKTGLAAPPDLIRWQDQVVGTPMLANDRAGCCTCSAAGHLMRTWTSNRGGVAVPVADSDVLAAYIAITGQMGAAFDPATGANDTGCVVLDVLNYWRHVGIAGEQLGAFALLSHTPDQLRQTIWLFGGCYLGVDLPQTAQQQIDAGQPWEIAGNGTGVSAPGSWGGHAVPALGYDAYGVWVATWGQIQRASWAWLAAYIDEAYALFDGEWITDDAPAPNGIDAATLRADLQALAA